MRKLLLAIAAFAALGLSCGSVFAADAGSALRLPQAVTTLKPNLQLASYKHCDYSGCYYCAYRECDHYGYDYGRKYCTHYHYYDCSPYHGGGYRYHGGGGGC